MANDRPASQSAPGAPSFPNSSFSSVMSIPHPRDTLDAGVHGGDRSIGGSMPAEGRFDLVVVGGGVGGLATAALAQRAGLRVALLEAHTKLGGCAGYFARGPYHFDAGATALMGLQPGEPMRDFLTAIGAEFESVPSSAYRVCLPDREL